MTPEERARQLWEYCQEEGGAPGEGWVTYPEFASEFVRLLEQAQREAAEDMRERAAKVIESAERKKWESFGQGKMVFNSPMLPHLAAAIRALPLEVEKK